MNNRKRNQAHSSNRTAPVPHLILHGEGAAKVAGARPRYTDDNKYQSREGS